MAVLFFLAVRKIIIIISVDLVMFVCVLANKAWQLENYCPVKRSKVEELIICVFHRLANKTREGFYWQFHFTVFSFVGQYR